MRFCILLISLLFLHLSAHAACDLFTQDMKGAFTPGYTVIHTYDYTRTIGVSDSSTNKKLYRPMQISIWYPAKKTSKHHITVRDYFCSAISKNDFSKNTDADRTIYYEQYIKQYRRQEDIKRLMGQETGAFYDAKFADGTFPLILYIPGGGEEAFENFALFELLASNGYIVASVPSMGSLSSEIDFDENLAYDAQLNDLRFLYSCMRGYPHVDTGSIATMGFCMGTIAGVNFAHENADIDAIVSLYGAIDIPGVRNTLGKFPYHDFANRQLAYFTAAGSEEQRDSFMFNTIRAHDACMLRLNGEHTVFTSFYIFQTYFRQKPETHTVSRQSYSALCAYVLSFCNAYLKNDPQSLAFLHKEVNSVLNNSIIKSYSFKPASGTLPDKRQFTDEILTMTSEKITERINSYHAIDPSAILFIPEILVSTGYRYAREKKYNEAIGIFTVLTVEFPTLWQGYAGLGDVYYDMGKNEESKTAFSKILTFDPTNEIAIQSLKILSAKKQ